MGYRNYLLFVLLIAFTSPTFAQRTNNRGEIVMTTDELKSLARKLAELRAQRVALIQQRQQQWQAYYAAQAQQQGEAAGAKQLRIERRVVFDTIETIDPQTYEMEIEVVRREEEVVGPQYGTEARLSELQSRLDRQEQLLLEIRDGRMATTTVTTKSADQERRDAEIEALLRRTNNPEALTRSDLNRLTQEVGDLNRELSNMRGRLQDEERRRRRAEDRMEDYLRDQRAYTRDRDLDRDFDINLRDRRDRLAVQPNIITPTPAPETVIIRDTVYQDRTRTDTVQIVREITPEPRVVRDTVVRTNTVREVETVQLAAKEPIGFPTIFFANNSATLSTTHRNILSSMLEEMRDKGGYRVRLTGYASPSGNADYNQQLSARRAEAVKQGLLQLGIAESRIRIVAGGIDYQPSSPAAARRVEVQAIPE